MVGSRAWKLEFATEWWAGELGNLNLLPNGRLESLETLNLLQNARLGSLAVDAGADSPEQYLACARRRHEKVIAARESKCLSTQCIGSSCARSLREKCDTHFAHDESHKSEDLIIQDLVPPLQYSYCEVVQVQGHAHVMDLRCAVHSLSDAHRDT